MLVMFKETSITNEVVVKIFGKSWKGFSYGGQGNSCWKNVIVTV